MKILMAHGADPQIATKDHTHRLMAFAGVGFTLGIVHHRSHAEDMEALRYLLLAARPRRECGRTIRG